MPAIRSAALPVTYVVLRVLIVLNWLTFAATLFLLVAPFTRDWIVEALDLQRSPSADRIVFGLRAIAVIGLAMAPFYHIILTRLSAIVASTRAGDPFTPANVSRLRQIGWTAIGLQLGGLVIAGIVDTISTKAHPVDIDAGPSVAGWLAMLLAFVVAQGFAEGARMRNDLEGTV